MFRCPEGNGIRSRWPAAGGLLLALAAAAHAWGQCTYEATPIVFPVNCAFGEVLTFAYGLNDDGWICGTYWCPIWEGSRAYYRTPAGVYFDLGIPSGVYSVSANDINNTGLICGTARFTGFGFRGYIYEIASQEWTWIEPNDPIDQIQAVAINDAGQVCGQIKAPTASSRALIWKSDGSLFDLGIGGTRALDINSHGVTVGALGFPNSDSAEGFIWDGETVTWIGEIPGGTSSAGTGINELNEVCADGLIESVEAFTWSEGLTLNLGSLPELAESRSNDINLRRQVTGSARNPEVSNSWTAFLWWQGQMADLNLLLANPESATITAGHRFNANGDIICHAENEVYQNMGVLLEPVDASTPDTDGDCDTDVWDLLKVLQDWGANISPADFDSNGLVNVSDLLLVLAHWSS